MNNKIALIRENKRKALEYKKQGLDVNYWSKIYNEIISKSDDFFISINSQTHFIYAEITNIRNYGKTCKYINKTKIQDSYCEYHIFSWREK